MKLVVVESPTKARTIGRFLGSDYVIRASMGHLIDLPKSTIAIDFEHDFKPLYEVVNDKKKIISDLKSNAKNADSIILATDPDREGEAIAAHVANILGDKGDFRRIVFHEITKEAIEEALRSPREIDRNLVDAQTARRVLDRIVGYKLSPMLWKKVRRGLSAGRVQSIALRLIIEREREIEKFGKEKYWTLHVILSKAKDPGGSSATPQNDNQNTEFELIEINGEKIELQSNFQLYDGVYKITKTTIDLAEKAQKLADDLRTKSFKVSDVLQKEVKRSPMPPYTTSTLQQDAARRMRINGKRTMSLAQKLYEEGFITYHRTDSVTISQSAISSIRNFVTKEYGDAYAPEKQRLYFAKQKLAQEAHEAIRPTSFSEISNLKFQISNSVGEQGWKLFEMIWRRAVASQMSDAIIESTAVFVDTVSNVILSETKDPRDSSASPQNDKSGYKLKANGSVLAFDGFLKVNPLGLTDNKLPKFSAGEDLDLIDALLKEHETLPPPRYNDSSIIKTLEEKGIGRPSTYATIISTIEARGYIERVEAKFIPTVIGIAVNDFLVINFSEIDDIPFTAEMEDELDQIANGEKKWVDVMRAFYTPFEKNLQKVGKAERVKIAVEETDEKCPLCGKGNLIIRTGKFGKFLACAKFPECKFTKPFVEDTGLSCPKCGGGGPPATPSQASPLAKQGEAAGDSGLRGGWGQIVIKKTRKGRKFYGCSNYPKCDFAAWKLEDVRKIAI